MRIFPFLCVSGTVTIFAANDNYRSIEQFRLAKADFWVDFLSVYFLARAIVQYNRFFDYKILIMTSLQVKRKKKLNNYEKNCVHRFSCYCHPIHFWPWLFQMRWESRKKLCNYANQMLVMGNKQERCSFIFKRDKISTAAIQYSI